MSKNPFGTGAQDSHQDPRTIIHQLDMANPLVKGGVEYLPGDIEHQHKVGICTAISLVQLIEKQTGKKYSPDFQYFLQKKFYDKNWKEGSCILNALKVGKKFGFLPLEHSPIKEEDRLLPYSEYIKKLQAISDMDIVNYSLLMENPIKGYAKVNLAPGNIADAIANSKAGILCRYGCSKNWWTSIKGIASWLPKDINPLRNGKPTSGHAIIMNQFDYSKDNMQKLANTWGNTWCLQGCADINWDNYEPTEAWTILDYSPEIKPLFTKTLKLGMRDPEVKQLQKKLGVIQTGYFGLLTLRAVRVFQEENDLQTDGICGPKTRECLNRLLV